MTDFINKQTLATSLLTASILAVLGYGFTLMGEGAFTRLNSNNDARYEESKRESRDYQARMETKVDSALRLLTLVEKLSEKTAENVDKDDLNEVTISAQTTALETRINQIDQEATRANTMVLRIAGRCCPSILADGVKPMQPRRVMYENLN